MRKFTAKEINEVAEVFKETLKACTSSKKTGGWFEFDYDNWVPTTKATVSGQEVDLATLPRVRLLLTGFLPTSRKS